MPRPQFRMIPETSVAYKTQLATTNHVVLFNLFVVPTEKREAFLEYWHGDATFIKAQYGMIPAQFHQGIAGSNVYINTAQWESVKTLSRAFHSEGFQTGLERCPEGIISYPLLLRKEGVSGICIVWGNRWPGIKQGLSYSHLCLL